MILSASRLVGSGTHLLLSWTRSRYADRALLARLQDRLAGTCNHRHVATEPLLQCFSSTCIPLLSIVTIAIDLLCRIDPWSTYRS